MASHEFKINDLKKHVAAIPWAALRSTQPPADSQREEIRAWLAENRGGPEWKVHTVLLALILSHLPADDMDRSNYEAEALATYPALGWVALVAQNSELGTQTLDR